MAKTRALKDIGKTDELRIRNVDTEVVLKLNDMARKRGMSRSEYMRGILSNHAYSLEIKELDSGYRELFKTVIDVMEGNAMLLHDVLEQQKEHTEMLQEIKGSRAEDGDGTETFFIK